MYLKRALYVIVALQVALAAYAVDEIRNTRLEGSNVSVGKKLAVQDDKFPAFYTAGWDNAFAYMKNTGTIEFGIDETKRAFYSSDFSVEVTFDVTATDKYNNTQTFTGKQLKVIYHTTGSYTDKAKLVLEGFVKLDVSITNIDSKNLPAGTPMAMPGELYLEAEMATDRHYLFYTTAQPASTPANINYNVINPCAANTELEVYWDYAPGAEEYELEWTWVNDYTGSAQAYDFRFDATRVVTKNTFYRIPLIYEGGNILYRLRHIGRGGTNFEQRVEGPWINVPESGLVSAYPSNLKFNVGSYYGDQFNWSSTLTFDENGRKGSGVSFMDGMLMGRQSLAKLNTDNKVIVQSVIYDSQGRPAISVLPAPVNSQCLLYQEGINNNPGGTLYGTADFDDDAASACENATDPLNVNAGASNYYSSSNSNKAGAQGYLPVAAGLPFVQVEYTNDMTGRIKSQSMPGEAHKLGEGKETKFFYTNPGDGELYQLFGSEVGNAKHYDKNIVGDANGQLSASYLDMEGRVVATALLGPKPLNVDGIEDYDSSVPLTDDMIKYNVPDNDNYTLTSTKNIFIEQANAVQTFTYEFMPEDFTDACAPTLCFDCIYEVEFRITDNCNENIITPVSVVVGNLSQTQSILNNCDETMLKYELSPGTPLSVTFPKVGNYTITKILRVSNKNLDQYVSAYIANNTCFDSYEQILAEQIDAIDFSSCNMDCESCSTSVAAYITAYPSSHGGAAISSEESERLYNECKAICMDQLDPCMAARQQMLQDFSPGGQYAAYDPLTYTSSDNTSIFNPSNVFGISYSNCSLAYEDANGNPNPTVDVMRSNQLVSLPVCSLTVKEFIQHFQPSWAKAFLNYHPEKCYLDFCDQNKASDQYDYGMLSTTSYDEAVVKGYFKPITGLTLPSAMCATGTVQQSLDPFFTGTGFGAVTTDNTALLYNNGGTAINNYYTLMLLYMNTQYPAYGANIDLFDVAQANVNGANPTSGSSYQFGCTACDKDKLWAMYRTLYLQQKLRLVAQARMDFVMKNGCFNGCMQGSGLNPFEPVTTTSPAVTATSLNFIEAPTFACPPPSSLYSFYEFYTITGYPVAKIPYTKLLGSGYNSSLHDDYFQTPTPNAYGQIPACTIGNSSNFSGKTAHFTQLPFTTNGLLSFYDNLISNNSNSGPGFMPGSVTIPPAAGTANTHCQSTCESYVEEWVNKLKACNPVFDEEDPNFNSSANVAIRDAIMDELVNVCVSGCNPQNPFGASTSDPTLASPPTYTSFQQVIDHFATVYPTIIPNPNSVACSALNLDFPAPYGHDYSGSGNAQNKLDTCGCNKIYKNDLEFNTLSTAGTLPAGVTTPAQYFAYIYNVPLYNYQEILCKCDAARENTWSSNYSWSQGESQALLANGIPVPEALSCTKCLICDVLTDYLGDFNYFHPDYIGTPQYNDLLENSLNASLNMNLTAEEYLDFYKACTQGTGSGCNMVSVKTQLAAFVNAYIALVKAQPQPPTGPVSIVVTNVSHPAFFGSCLFGCNDETDLPTNLTIGIAYDPPSGPSPARLLVNSPTFNYWGGNGDCTELNCSPNFDAITYITSTAVTSYVITDVLITSAVSGFNCGLVGHYTDGTGYHSFSGTPFNYPCLNPGYTGPPEGAPGMLCNQPFSPSLPIYEDCISSMLNQAENNAHLIYQSYLDKYTALFKDKYRKKCMQVQETYQRNYSLNEYHYTLYYYDQAGNLVRTVAPKGVQKLSATDVALLQSAIPPVIYPHHTYVTNYKYQSYGAPLSSNTPDEQYWDAGTSTFKPAITDYVYDNIGRIQLSYNGQQKIDGKYSYTLYDEIGRIKEVGVLGNLGSVTLSNLQTQIAANTFESYLSTHTPAFTRSEVIQTYYDVPLNSTISGQFGSGGQQNLRNRVATVSYEAMDDNNSSTYTYATHYTYDEHGNVGRIIQDVPTLEPLNKQYYTMDYDYDLISGNVNQVTYQAGSADQFMHRYEYDADNRLHNVYTSRDKVSWDKDAKYFYYEHGPLARTELGDQKVQGSDFAYTIHGWIKAVNSDILSEHTDMGKDGAQGNRYLSTQQNLHRFVGKDAAAYSLSYYQQGSLTDYTAIKTFNSTNDRNMIASTANILSSGSSFNLQTDGPDLYNGNISSMVTSIYDMDLNSNNTHAENTAFPQITAYRYDQLHRIKQMKAFRDVSLSTNEWNTATSGNYDGSYFTQFTYDKNGNINTQSRDGAAFMTGLGLPMDNMTYITQNTSADVPTNRLIGVNDAATGAYTNDIKGTSTAVDGTPSSYDYEYDALGSLVKDKKEYIDAIEWTVDRKVKKVIRDISAMVAAGKNLPDLEFEYDANRQRIAKIVKKHDNSTGALLGQDNWEYTYYVRDASGNITATYGKKYVPVVGHANTYTEELSLQEHDLYGSARLGTLLSNTTISSREFTATLSGGLFSGITYAAPGTPPAPCTLDIISPTGETLAVACPMVYERLLGNKRYELTNHLGNVLTVLSDRKLQNPGSTEDLTNDYEQPFYGQSTTHLISGAHTCLTSLFNPFTPALITQVHPGDAVTVTMKAYYDTAPTYDSPGLLALAFVDAAGNFLYSGGTQQWYRDDASLIGVNNNLSVTQTVPTTLYMDAAASMPYTGAVYAQSFGWHPGDSECWFDDHSLSVNYLVPLVNNYNAEILETHDYYPFGSAMAGRETGSDYKFSYNGKFDDKGDGWQTQDYGFRSYDYRLGRFFCQDPVSYKFAYMTPYQFASNRPIDGIDLDGLEYVRADQMIQGFTAKQIFKNKAIVVQDGIEYVKLGMHMFINDQTQKTFYSMSPQAPDNSGNWTQVSEWLYGDEAEIDLLKGKGWHSYQEKNKTGEHSCFVACQLTAEEFESIVKDPKSYLNVVDEKGNVNEFNGEKAIDFINRELEAGRLVLIGVDGSDTEVGNDATNKKIDHWVIVTGRYKSGHDNRFNFYENGIGSNKGSIGTDKHTNFFSVTGSWLKGQSIVLQRWQRFNPIGIRGTSKKTKGGSLVNGNKVRKK